MAISEIINVPDTVAASTSTSKIPITAEKSTLPRSSDEAIQPSPQSKHSENTPAKDIIEETDQDSEENTNSTQQAKRGKISIKPLSQLKKDGNLHHQVRPLQTKTKKAELMIPSIPEVEAMLCKIKYPSTHDCVYLCVISLLV